MSISETFQAAQESLTASPPIGISLRENIIMADKNIGDKLIKLGAKPFGNQYYDCSNLDL